MHTVCFAFTLLFTRAVMPAVLSKPDPSTMLVTGHQSRKFSIGYTSWPNKTTSIAWYHNGVALPDDSPLVQTTFGLTGSTNLTFERTMRAHSGTWTVVLENNVDVFPEEIRRVEESFEIRVISKRNYVFTAYTAYVIYSLYRCVVHVLALVYIQQC